MGVERNGTAIIHAPSTNTVDTHVIITDAQKHMQKSQENSLLDTLSPCTCIHSVTPHFFNSNTTKAASSATITAIINTLLIVIISLVITFLIYLHLSRDTEARIR